MGYKIVKRMFDIAASFLATIVFLIPWLIISAIIKIQSPGSVLFKPERVGKDGKTFVGNPLRLSY
jgi:lipopolysaccharide/colanic/teichoic acid biosynthesis glycosyltransferase